MRICDRCGRKLGFGACTVTITKIILFHSHRTFELCPECASGVTKSITEYEKDVQGVE